MEVLDRTVQIGSSILLQGITALSQYIDIKPPGRLHTHHINYTDSSSDNFISSPLKELAPLSENANVETLFSYNSLKIL